MASGPEKYSKEYIIFIKVDFQDPSGGDDLGYELLHSNHPSDFDYSLGKLVVTCRRAGSADTKGIELVLSTFASFRITSCTAYTDQPDNMCHVSGNPEGSMQILQYTYDGSRDVTAINFENTNVYIRLTFKTVL